MSFINNISSSTISNTFFREVIFTGKFSQLVVMSLRPGEDIGEEIHENVEQLIFNQYGTGKGIINNTEYEFKRGDVLVIKPGEKHNIINIGETDLKLYTVYAPANHIDKRIHKTKLDGENDTADHDFGHHINN